MIFGLHLIVAVKDKGLQVQGSIECAVANTMGLHRLAAHLVVGEQHSVPGKHRVALQFQVFHDVAERIHVVLAASAHLLLSGFQVVEYGCLGGKLRIDGKRLHKHTYGVVELLRLSAVVDRVEKCFLLVVELGQQISVGHREERALENSVLLAELVNAVHFDGKRAEQAGFLQFRLFTVG